jgi:hypothetical protein
MGRVWPRHEQRGRPLNAIVRCDMSDDAKVQPPEESAILRWLDVRANFIVANTLLVGGAGLVGLYFALEETGGHFGILWLFFVPVVFGGGYVWALVMWQRQLGWIAIRKRENDT